MNEIQKSSDRKRKEIDFVLIPNQNSSMPLCKDIENVNYSYGSNPFRKTYLANENIVNLPLRKKSNVSTQFLLALILFVIFFMNFLNDNKKTHTNHENSRLHASVIPVNQTTADESPAPPAKKEVAKQKKQKNQTKNTSQNEVNLSDENKLQKTEKFIIPEFPVIKTKNKNQLKEYGQMAEKIRADYLSRFKKIALEEQKRFGIPVSITLGLAIINSEFGSNLLAREGNNHFSIKCTDNNIPMGKGMKGQIVHEGVCYTQYSNVWNSFRANSQLLKQKYPSAFQDKSTEKIITRLEQSGFFNNKTFTAETLKSVIKMYVQF